MIFLAPLEEIIIQVAPQPRMVYAVTFCDLSFNEEEVIAVTETLPLANDAMNKEFKRIRSDNPTAYGEIEYNAFTSVNDSGYVCWEINDSHVCCCITQMPLTS
jgi:hypothetical protein